MKLEHAETLALQGVAFLAERPEELGRFLRNSGLEAADLRARLADSGVLASACTFLLSEDDFVLDFCRNHGCRPQDLHRARYVLEGETRNSEI
jgi:hypothetical protein